MKTFKTTKEPDLVSGFKKALREAEYVNQTDAGYTIKPLPIEDRVNTVEWKLDKMDRALRTLASWNKAGEWSGALAYVNAILDEPQQNQSEGNDDETT